MGDGATTDRDVAQGAKASQDEYVETLVLHFQVSAIIGILKQPLSALFGLMVHSTKVDQVAVAYAIFSQ